MRRLKARVEELEGEWLRGLLLIRLQSLTRPMAVLLAGATDGMSRRWAEQEATLRRTAIDVEALRGRTVRSSEAISLTTQTNAARAVEGEQAGSRHGAVGEATAASVLTYACLCVHRSGAERCQEGSQAGEGDGGGHTEGEAAVAGPARPLVHLS